MKGIDPLTDLVYKSRNRLSDRQNVQIVEGTAPNDLEGRYDRIVISCGISEDIWGELKQRFLRDDGVMVGPVSVQGGAQRLKRYRDGEEQTFGRVRFVGAR